MTDLECKYGKFFSVIWEDVKYYEGEISKLTQDLQKLL